IATDRCQLAPGNLPPGPIEFEPIPADLIEGEGKPSIDQLCRTRFADFLARLPN
ncbi:MAG: hypothetical protein HC923_06815, partial [Myxococcales bacterium]|nr:hypothetical protein [Myxococcales bacterium]